MKKYIIMLIVLATCVFAGPEPTNYDGLRSLTFGTSGYVVVSPDTMATITITPNISTLVLGLGGTLATLNLVLVSTNAGYDAFNGQIFTIAPQQAVSTLSVTSASTIKGAAATSLTSGKGLRYMYNRILNYFYRID